MIRPTTRPATVAVEQDSGPARSHRPRPGRGDDPAPGTVPASLTASDFGARIAQLLRSSAGAAALLPLGPGGCDDGCVIPAVYDRVTGGWRHLTDLQQCRRPAAAPTGSGARQ